MSAEHWSLTVEVKGMLFEIECVRRPFREGVQVSIETPRGVVSFSEFGLGDSALLEKARSMISALYKEL